MFNLLNIENSMRGFLFNTLSPNPSPCKTDKGEGKYAAFTLAEVLITLVIIGVIAAITVPSLIAKYQDQQLTSQFKKAYSSLSNAINKTNMLDFSGQAECYYGTGNLSANHSDCVAFFNRLAKNMNVLKTCKGNAKAKGCVPVYSSYITVGGLSGFSENNINNLNTVYVLSDGQIIIVYGYNMALFLVDINGFKGPNKLGYDLFIFHIFKKLNSGMYLRGATSAPEELDASGRTTDEMMKHAFMGKE